MQDAFLKLPSSGS